MSGGVFCPTCSSPLTWFPQLQQWGCDRCRLMVPSPVQMAPHQQMVPQPQMPPMHQIQPPPAPAKRGSHAPLAIGGVLLVGGIITVAVVASGGSSSKKTAAPSGPVASHDEPTSTSTSKPTLGDPVQAPVGDFWLWPRSDGSFLVTSSDLVAVFPRKPTFTVTPASAQTGDHAADMYTLTDDYGDLGKIQMTVAAAGRKLRDTGPMDPPASLASRGKVTTRTFEDRGLSVTEYLVESSTAPVSLRMNMRTDHDHGLIVDALFGAASDSPHAAFIDTFLKGLHLDASHDVAGDLSAVASKPSGGGFTVGDAQFHIDLPWEPKIERGRQHDTTFAKISLDHGDALVTLAVIEVPGWLGLRNTKDSLDAETTETADALTKALASQHAKAELARSKLGEVPVRVIQMKTAQGVITENWSVWDRFAHRKYQLTCVRADCGKILRTLTLTPKPSRPAD